MTANPGFQTSLSEVWNPGFAESLLRDSLEGCLVDVAASRPHDIE